MIVYKIKTQSISNHSSPTPPEKRTSVLSNIDLNQQQAKPKISNNNKIFLQTLGLKLK